MKDYIFDNPQMIDKDEILRISVQTTDNTASIKKMEKDIAETRNDLEKFMRTFTDKHIGKEYLILDGKTVESDVAYQTIYGNAKSSIYIIDNYIGLKTLMLLKDVSKNIEIIIFSDNVGKHLRKQDYVDFHNEYPDVDISFKTTGGLFHDRYIVLDYGKKTYKVYHCGGSSKDGGKRTMTIGLSNDKDVYKPIIADLLNNSELKLN